MERTGSTMEQPRQAEETHAVTDGHRHTNARTHTHTGEKTKMKMNARWETAFSSCSVAP